MSQFRAMYLSPFALCVLLSGIALGEPITNNPLDELVIQIFGTIEKPHQEFAAPAGSSFTVELTMSELKERYTSFGTHSAYTELGFDYTMQVTVGDWEQQQLDGTQGSLTISRTFSQQQADSLLFDIPFLQDISFVSFIPGSKLDQYHEQEFTLSSLRNALHEAELLHANLLIAPSFSGQIQSVRAVPEPACHLMVLVLGGIAFRWRRRRQS